MFRQTSAFRFTLGHASLAALLGAAMMVGGAAPANASGFAAARFGGEHGNPTESNPSSLYYNPGGIGMSKGTKLMIDLSLVWRDSTYDRPASAIDNPVQQDNGMGGTMDHPLGIDANTGEGAVSNFLLSPALAVTTDFGGLPIVAGFGFFAPFGGQAVWDEDASFEGSIYPGAVDGPQRWYTIEGTIRSLLLTAGAAYYIEPARLSIGVTGNLYINEVNTIRARNAPGDDNLLSCPSEGACVDSDGNTEALLAEGRSRIDVSGNNFGFGVGVLWEPLPEELWIGLSYQSQPGVVGGSTLEGTLENYLGTTPATQEDVKFTQTLPDIIRLGARYRPVPEVELRLFGDLTRWSVFENQCLASARIADSDLEDACKINSDGSSVNEEFATDIIQVLSRNWEDAFGIRLGASYWLMERDLELIVGGGFDGNAIPDDRLEPALFDMNKFSASLGARYAFIEQVALMVTATNLFYAERDTSNVDTANALAL
ncbi:MAG: outer membrane protein transport protein, partial [Myxococcota bacterium]